jgi:hypothetical protein
MAMDMVMHTETDIGHTDTDMDMDKDTCFHLLDGE